MAITKISKSELFNLDSTTEGVQLPSGPTITGTEVHYLVVAGGGGGGSNSNSGGGGAGGYRTSYPSGTPVFCSLGSNISVVVGTGGNGTAGAGGSGSGSGSSGTDSTLDSITSTGGGHGGWNSNNGVSGGSGGGQGFDASGTPGAGNAGGFTPAEGFNGGTKSGTNAGGGGGASEDGNTNGQSTGGDGAISTIITTSIASTYTVGEIDGSDVYFAGGGGGGVSNGTYNTGGKGGGANGGNASGSAAVNAPANTGGGGGGGEYNAGASEGGSGVVVIRVSSGIIATFSSGVTANGSAGGGSISPDTSTGDNIWVVTATTDTNQSVTFSGTSTSLGRPSSPTQGEMRYNTTIKQVEYFNGTDWFTIDYAPSTATNNFNTVLYTGNRPSTQSVANVGFKPDLVWVKLRSATGYGAVLADSVAGAQKFLDTSNTNQQTSSATSLVSFDTDGFSVGGYGNWNGGLSGANGTMVSWNWKAGGAPTATNSAGVGNVPTADSVKIDGSNATSALTGSIVATKISSNTAAGFSIINYSGTGVAGTMDHLLGVTPDLIFIKRLDTTGNWIVGSSGLTDWTKILKLNLTDGQASLAAFNDTAPTTTVFSIGTDSTVNNGSGQYIAYCFANIGGYQRIGTYAGNGLATGNMVTTGFEPAWLMVKEISADGDYWYIVDNKRNTSNPRSLNLFPNNTDAEGSYGSFNFLSTGFQASNNWSGTNGSGETYIYFAISS